MYGKTMFKLLLALLLSALLLTGCYNRSTSEAVERGQDRSLPAESGPEGEGTASFDGTDSLTPDLPAESRTPAGTFPDEDDELPSDETEEEETEEWLEPQPLSDNLTLQYTRDDWKRINTFLSNFSETYFLEYDLLLSTDADRREAYRDEYERVMYGYLHLKINDPSKVKTAGSYYYVTAVDMDKCLTRFFGDTVSASDKSRTYAGQYEDFTETVEYRSNAWYFPAADGEAYSQLTVVNNVYLNARGNYSVEFNVYELIPEIYFDTGLNSSYYSMTSAEAASDARLEYRYSGTAEVKDYQSGTYRSYQLVDYFIYYTY